MRPYLVFLLSLFAHQASAAEALSKQETTTLQSERCEPLVKAASEWIIKSASEEGKSPTERMIAALKNLQRPRTSSEADWRLCAALLERDLLTFLSRSRETEALVALKQMELGMKAFYDANKKLCPSSRRPVPAQLSVLVEGAYLSTAEDWEDAAWTCLAAGDRAPQRFQYEVKSSARSFEITARGYPGGDGKLVTWVLAGRVVADAVEVDPIQRK